MPPPGALAHISEPFAEHLVMSLLFLLSLRGSKLRRSNMQEFRQGGMSSELDDTAEGFCAFGLDVLRCPRCAGRMPLMATIDDLAVIQRILAHLGLPGARAGA